MWLTRPIYAWFKRALPKMTATERTAIEAGDVWVESNLMQGNLQWDHFYALPPARLAQEEQAFLDHQVETLCKMLNDWEINYRLHDLPAAVWNYIKQEKFLGMIIPKHYGGLGFSPAAHSAVITKIASCCGAAAVTVMVPNSLGPAELLIHYGTEQQKSYYLPKLASGEIIPCFALTSLEAGSDAASMPDTGIVGYGEIDGQRVKGIRLNWKKRYITLAPIASLVGVAVKVFDPDLLLGEHTEIGITLCLIPRNQPGVEIGQRHCPLHVGFMNGPVEGHDVFIPLDYVIGKEKGLGQGWRMLMECLAAGRGISLPANSVGGAMGVLRTTTAYAFLRKQFHLPIYQFEGIEANLAYMGGVTYLLEALQRLVNAALMQDYKPAIVSAIAKYHMTELARTVINCAMDIQAGKAIQLGPNNYVASFYQAVPIAITVEGANILTRNLIIFGQGLFRCHPYLRHEIEAVAESDPKTGFTSFDRLLKSHIAYFISRFARLVILSFSAGKFIFQRKKHKLSPWQRQLSRMSNALAFTTEIASLCLGGRLKRLERLSARLGDILSYLLIASAILKRFADDQATDEEYPFALWSVQFCLWNIQNSFNDFLANFPIRFVACGLKFLIFPYGNSYTKPSDVLEKSMVNALMDGTMRQRLTSLAFQSQDDKHPLGLLEKVFDDMKDVRVIESHIKANLPREITKTVKSETELHELGLQNQLISNDEFEFIQKTYSNVKTVLSVDSFAPDDPLFKN